MYTIDLYYYLFPYIYFELYEVQKAIQINNINKNVNKKLKIWIGYKINVIKTKVEQCT